LYALFVGSTSARGRQRKSPKDPFRLSYESPNPSLCVLPPLGVLLCCKDFSLSEPPFDISSIGHTPNQSTNTSLRALLIWLTGGWTPGSFLCQVQARLSLCYGSYPRLESMHPICQWVVPPTSCPYQVYNSVNGSHPHLKATMNSILLLEFPPLWGPTLLLRFLHSNVQIASLLWVLPLLRVDVSNLSMDHTPTSELLPSL